MVVKHVRQPRHYDNIIMTHHYRPLGTWRGEMWWDVVGVWWWECGGSVVVGCGGSVVVGCGGGMWWRDVVYGAATFGIMLDHMEYSHTMFSASYHPHARRVICDL